MTRTWTRLRTLQIFLNDYYCYAYAKERQHRQSRQSKGNDLSPAATALHVAAIQEIRAIVRELSSPERSSSRLTTSQTEWRKGSRPGLLSLDTSEDVLCSNDRGKPLSHRVARGRVSVVQLCHIWNPVNGRLSILSA